MAKTDGKIEPIGLLVEVFRPSVSASSTNGLFCLEKRMNEIEKLQEDFYETEDLLYRIARHMLNLDDLPLHKWGVKGAYLLSELERKDPDRYRKTVENQ